MMATNSAQTCMLRVSILYANHNALEGRGALPEVPRAGADNQV